MRLSFGFAVIGTALSLALSASAVVVAQGAAPDADRALERVVEFVSAQNGVRFDGEAAALSGAQGTGPAPLFTVFEGESEIPTGTRLRGSDRATGAAFESVVVGSDTFRRGGDGESFALVQGQFAVPLGSAASDAAAPVADALGELLPHRIISLINAATPAEPEGDADGFDLAARVTGKGLGIVAASAGLEAHLAFDTGPGGRIDRLSARLLDPTGPLAEVSYTFRDWDAPIRVTPPEQVVAVAGADADDIARFDGAPLFQPVAVPEGWVLEGAERVPEIETPDRCELVVLRYADRFDAGEGDASFLEIAQLGPGCGPSAVPPAADDFAGPGYEGYVVDQGDDRLAARLLVTGRTVMRISTDLTADDLAVVLSALDPFDLTKAPRPLNGIGVSRFRS